MKTATWFHPTGVGYAPNQFSGDPVSMPVFQVLSVWKDITENQFMCLVSSSFENSVSFLMSFFLWEWWEFLIHLIHFYSKKASILVQITRGREITAAGFKQVDIYRTCASLHTNEDLCPKTLGRKKRIAKGTLYHAPSTTTAQISASCEEKL